MDRDLLKKNVVLTVFVLSLAIVILPMVETSSQKHDAFGSPFTTVVNVSHDNGLSYGQKIAASGNNVYVVWTNGTASTNPPRLPPMINNILFAKSTDGGSTFGTPIRISNNPGDNSLSPVIAQDGTNIYISWIQSNFGNPDIYFAKSTDGGTTFSSPINISRSGSAGVEEEFVAASGNHVYIAWVNNLLASNQGILYVNSTDNGVSFSLPHQMSGGLTNNHDPKILVNGINVHLAWDSQDGGVYLRSSVDSGHTFGSSVNISRGIQGGGTDIAMVGNYIYATWYDFGTSNHILFAKSADSGITFGSPIRVSTSSISGFFPQLAASGSHVSLTWQQELSTFPYYDIDVVTSTDNGNTFSSPLSITYGSIESHSPQINATANNVYLTWQGYHPNPDVFYSNSTDYGLTYTFPRNTSQDNLAQNPQLAASSGNVYLAWTDNSAGNGDIYVTAHSSIPSPNTVLTMSANATTVIQGKAINFTYNEQNTGNVPLTNPSVSDNSCSPVTSHNIGGFNEGDLNHNNILDSGETWVFQCIQQQTTVGTITHTATGSGTDPSGNIITAPAYPSEQKSLSVTVNPATPNTVLTMSANATTVVYHQAINFTYYEQNTGNVQLTSPSVTDSSCAHPPVSKLNPFTGRNKGDINNNGILDLGETWIYQCVNIQNSTGTITHTATGTGTDPSGNIITAPAYPSEQKSLSVTVNPATATLLTMSANATTVNLGKAINFTYNEANVGNTKVLNPSVTDSSCAHPPVSKLNPFTGRNKGDINNNGILDLGETWIYQCVNIQNSTGTITHTATGTGTDTFGNAIGPPNYVPEQTSLSVTVNPSATVTYQSATGAGPVTFSTSTGQFSHFEAVSQSSLSPSPPAGSYPCGFFNWTITGLPVGGSTTITISCSAGLGSVYEKLIGGTWYAIPLSSNQMTLTDGASGQDADQTANGQITDPGGIVVAIPVKVTGGGNIGKGTEFGLEADSEKMKTKGEVEYNDKNAKIELHSTKLTFVSANSDLTQAVVQGTAKVNDKSGFAIQVNVSDPDKTGNHDTFSITIADSTGKMIYHNSGTVHGHIEIHKTKTSDNDKQEKNSK